MNICMLTRALPAHKKGGVPDHSWMLSRGLVEKGHTVTLLTTRLQGSPESISSDGVTIHYLEGTIPDSYTGGWWRASATRTAELHRSRPFDLIHCQSFSGYGVVNRDVHRSLGVPAIVTQHGTYYDELVTRWRNGFSLNPYRSAKNVAAILHVLRTLYTKDVPYLRRADGVIATSRQQYDLIRRIYGIPGERLHTVFNGMDLSLFTPGAGTGALRRKLGVGTEAPLLLCIARLIRDKGIGNILRAMPAILVESPECRLVIVGEGPHRAEMESMGEKLGLRGVALFAGEADFRELPGYFRDCDVFVNPTDQQNGYDLTMVEAMACGKPVVSTRIGSTPTLINHERDGFLFPAGDIGALAAAVIRLLNDNELRDRLGKSGREKVIHGFDLESMISGTVGVYERLLDRYGKREI